MKGINSPEALRRQRLAPGLYVSTPILGSVCMQSAIIKGKYGRMAATVGLLGTRAITCTPCLMEWREYEVANPHNDKQFFYKLQMQLNLAMILSPLSRNAIVVY